MSNTTSSALASCIERARKVLQYEQRTNHQDRAIKPGGLELFAVRWADEASAACKSAGLDISPIHHFTEHLERYRQQDPMQRAASLRAALAILNELDTKSGETPAPEDAIKRVPTAMGVVGRDKANPKGGRVQGGETPAPRDAINRVPTARRDTNGAPESPIRLEAGMTAGHTVLTLLSADVTAVPGVGASAAAKLHSLGIKTVRDLLFYFPREHRDYSKLEKIARLPFNEVTTTMGLIWEVKNIPGGSGRMRTVATISD
ncbi:MAG: hypothetical protein JOZ18_10855, partial [Chloroflexi bacterium]|nr:hypothetical protein [Chloroflexota bacterium]